MCFLRIVKYRLESDLWRFLYFQWFVKDKQSTHLEQCANTYPSPQSLKTDVWNQIIYAVDLRKVCFSILKCYGIVWVGSSLFVLIENFRLHFKDVKVRDFVELRFWGLENHQCTLIFCSQLSFDSLQYPKQSPCNEFLNSWNSFWFTRYVYSHYAASHTRFLKSQIIPRKRKCKQH